MDVVLRVLRGPIVLGHVRALAGETVRVSAAVARQVLAERPGWVEVVNGDGHDLFIGPPVPAEELADPDVQALLERAPDAAVVLTADLTQARAEPVEPPAQPVGRKGRK